MIFGNPDNFAIYVDEVRHWLIDQEINGIVGIYINSQFF
ncbi:Imm42 family immunity protein [Moraxella catarrhalis]|nr:Imm42 family immunity protein [Moraxella catarrhalis]